ncbi:inositol monophosphatase family protein [Halobacteriovorax sp. GB3]|uniref:inositol monophosphatase family protein n=1 Tax=Halobacteriovorax sp. GB3 TaxID=2719615 RepID=UPI00235DFA90|nr:inositol monophosphatase family protein [Halobacteriovorax sp. GB3]MDD0854069.1 inositol monophosphatase family protein [Halobacteriovorax sp. GB3]
MMKNTELKKTLDIVAKISIETGAKLMKYQKKLNRLNITSKEAQGVFSEADVEAEKHIIKSLKRDFPTIPILGEESAFQDYQGKKEAYQKYAQMDYAWVVDPLDGTNNFLNGMDYFAVCISLVKKGQPILGVVHRPTSAHTFMAYQNGGSFFKVGAKRAKKIFNNRLSKKLNESMLVTGFITEKGKPNQKEFDLFWHMMGTCRGIRRMGSAALDLCYVAEGTFDGFWERGLAPWDMAAAAIICQEAGVKVTDYNAKKFSPFGETILAARSPVHAQMKKLINS